MYKIGVSSFPVIMGNSPFSDIRELWMQMKGILEKPEQTFGMLRGSLFEDDIISLFEQHYHVKVNTTDELFKLGFDKFEIVCKIDGYIIQDDEKIVVEVKLTNNPVLEGYYAQVMGEIMVMQNYGFSDKAYLVVVDGGKLFTASSFEDCCIVYVIDFNEDYKNLLLERINEFVDTLELNECPYPEKVTVNNEESIVITIDSLDELGDEYERVSGEINSLSNYKKAIMSKMESLADGKEYIRGNRYGLKKISYTADGCIEVPLGLEDTLTKFNIPHKVKQGRDISYYKLTKLKGDK